MLKSRCRAHGAIANAIFCVIPGDLAHLASDGREFEIAPMDVASSVAPQFARALFYGGRRLLCLKRLL
jgi:hypothetical protein